jgi:hypothetical protein
MPDFWKVWKAKFKRNINKEIGIFINGCLNNNDVANAFAEKFSVIYSESNVNHCNTLDDVYFTCSISAKERTEPLPVFTVENIEIAAKSLKQGKACGPDDIAVEHILFAHYILFIHLKLLFHMLLSHE